LRHADTPAEVRAQVGASRREQVLGFARRLIAAASPNPPGDTGAAAEVAAACLRETIPDAEVVLHRTSDLVVNLVARIRGAGPGPRVILNGHLDTYPVGDADAWTTDPAGELRGDRLYGRGSADMKGGIAASMAALAALAATSRHWPGEAVLTLAGDEESMGPLGTRWLMDNVPHASGDWVIIGDAGSPHVLRFGEKGFLWIEVEARGRPAHGAHVHLGDNAIDRLRAALDRLDRAFGELRVDAPAVREAIERSKPISEPLAGAGEAETLGRLTLNLGTIAGGMSPNLVPASARASADIRIPVGLSLEAVEGALAEALDLPGVSCRVLRRFAPNFTPPDHPLVTTCARVAREVLGHAVAANMRVGGSDSRWFRMAGLPTVVYGPTPHGMGGPDEYALVDELDQVARVHALTAFDMLRSQPT
jgi:acetylornithine deacetylase/succinyl-diaminopimelate desuccinylase-like protein